MAITATLLKNSVPVVGYLYNITGLANGSNAISVSDFPPDGGWTPSHIWCFPYDNASGAIAYADNASINQSNGVVNFNLWVSTAPTSVDVLIF
jgi:hypothetical protein